MENSLAQIPNVGWPAPRHAACANRLRPRLAAGLDRIITNDTSHSQLEHLEKLWFSIITALKEEQNCQRKGKIACKHSFLIAKIVVPTTKSFVSDQQRQNKNDTTARYSRAWKMTSITYVWTLRLKRLLPKTPPHLLGPLWGTSCCVKKNYCFNDQDCN